MYVGDGNISQGFKFPYIIIVINQKKIFFYIDFHVVFNMERKLREISGSLVVTIPKQVCDLYGFKNGDMLNIEPIGVGELRLRKVS